MQATLSEIFEIPSCIPYDGDRLDCKLLALAEEISMTVRYLRLQGTNRLPLAVLEMISLELMDYSTEAFRLLPPEPGQSFGRGRVR